MLVEVSCACPFAYMTRNLRKASVTKQSNLNLCVKSLYFFPSFVLVNCRKILNKNQVSVRTIDTCITLLQRQAERIKREKAQAKRGDDLDPHARDDLIVPVQRFQGSRLASGAVPVPYEQNGSRKDNKERNSRARKAARVSTTGSSIAAAIVEAENDLEAQVILPIWHEMISDVLCNKYLQVHLTFMVTFLGT